MLACKNPDVLRMERLDTPRLGLDPITLDDAGSLVGVFDDPAMLQFIGGAELTPRCPADEVRADAGGVRRR